MLRGLIYSEIYVYRNMCILVCSDMFRELIFIYILRSVQRYSTFDTHKIFPPHEMRGGNVDTSYYRYAGYGSSIFTTLYGLYPYGLSDVIKIFFETGKWDNLSLID